jgi:hypothetical protein
LRSAVDISPKVKPDHSFASPAHSMFGAEFRGYPTASPADWLDSSHFQGQAGLEIPYRLRGVAGIVIVDIDHGLNVAEQ